MSVRLCLFLGLFFLWFFPGFYLFTHEAGHCVTSAQFGASRNQLYLSCSGEKAPLFSYSFSNSSSVFVCKPFFYRFILQEGFCSYELPLEENPSSASFKQALIAVAGSAYGAFASYLLLLFLGFCFFLFRKDFSSFDFKGYLLYPFRLFSLLDKVKIKPIGKKILISVLGLGYVLHIERLFYGFFPSAVQIFFPPIGSITSSDGSHFWLSFMSESSFFIGIAWVSWFVKIFVCSLVVRKVIFLFKKQNKILKNDRRKESFKDKA